MRKDPSMLDDNNLVATTDAMATRLSELDSQLLEIARRSQDAERLSLRPGEIARGHGERCVIGDYYMEQASRAEASARADIENLMDKLTSRAEATVTEEASASELSNVAFLLDRGELSDEELVALYDRHRSKWALERVIRNEASKRHIRLHLDPSTSVLNQADRLREKAAYLASNRWTNGDRQQTVLPPSWAASGMLDMMRGVDALGNPMPID